MPNWKIHLEVGKRLIKYFNYYKDDAKLFLLGNILPDINNCFIVKDIDKNLSHEYTHYHTEVKSYINFYNRYKNQLDNPLICGYYIHLFTDYFWNNDFYTRFNNIKMDHSKKRILKQQDFMIYNNKYIDNYINFNNYQEVLNKLKVLDRVELNESDLKKVDYYLRNTPKEPGSLYFYKENELDDLLDKTVSNIENKMR